MNMKKLSAAVIVMLGLGVSAAQAAGDGTLNFAGSVQSGSCSIDASTKDLAVAFNGYSATTLNTVVAGTTDVSMQKPVTIKLTGCPENSSSARVKIEGKASGILPNVFVGNSTARYVGVIISDAKTGTVITPNYFDQNRVAIGAGDNNIDLLVGLTKTSDSTAVAGNIDVPLTFSLIFE